MLFNVVSRILLWIYYNYADGVNGAWGWVGAIKLMEKGEWYFKGGFISLGIPVPGRGWVGGGVICNMWTIFEVWRERDFFII